jgi:hypothetical protein
MGEGGDRGGGAGDRDDDDLVEIDLSQGRTHGKKARAEADLVKATGACSVVTESVEVTGLAAGSCQHIANKRRSMPEGTATSMLKGSYLTKP